MLTGRLQVEDVKFEQAPTIADCFPSSEKVYKEVECQGNILEVPFRRIHLAEGSGHLDVQDTSGPQVRFELLTVMNAGTNMMDYGNFVLTLCRASIRMMVSLSCGLRG